ETAGLARLVHDLHALHLHFEHQLDGLLDVGLGGVALHAERVLVVVLHRERRLLGDVRGDEHIHELFALHCRRSSSIFTAPTVASTLSKLARLSGSSFATSMTATCGRLRAARKSFSSIA